MLGPSEAEVHAVSSVFQALDLSVHDEQAVLIFAETDSHSQRR